MSEMELASKAWKSFVGGDFEGALSLLNEVSAAMRSEASSADGELHPDQLYKVRLNSALAEYGASGYSKPHALESALAAIAAAMRERAEGGSSSGSEAPDAAGAVVATAKPRGPAAGNNGVSIAEDTSTANAAAIAAGGGLRGESAADEGPDEEAGLGVWGELDASGSVLLYNLAVLRYQQRRHGEALALLEHLFQRIEPLDDALAVHVCLLLLELLCHANRGALLSETEISEFGRRTSQVIAYLERPNLLSTPSQPTASDASSPEAAAAGGGGADGGAGSATGDVAGASSVGGSGGSVGAGAAEAHNLEQREFHFRLRLCKAKVLLLQLQPKLAKKEIKAAFEIFQKHSAAAAQAQPESVVSVAAAGAFAPLPPPGVQNCAALYLKANFEHLRQNSRKAIKLLGSCHGLQGAEEFSGPVEPVSAAYYNNMGCLHQRLGRHHAALGYFRKALLACGGTETGVAPDGRVCPVPTCEILYNAGLQLLVLGRPADALRCLEGSAPLFYGRPRLWLRVAEACILFHRDECRRKVQGQEANRNGLIIATVGSGAHRRVVLATGPPNADIDAGAELPSAAAAAAAAAAVQPPPPPAESGGGTWARAVKGNSGAAAAAAAAPAAAAEAAAVAWQERPLKRAAECLHTCLYLCAGQARAQREREAGARGGLGQAIMGSSGVPPRAMGKGLAARAASDGGGGSGGGSSVGSSVGGSSISGVRVEGGWVVPSSQERLRDPTAQAALAAIAYVYLGLEEPIQALHYARQLLAAPPIANLAVAAAVARTPPRPVSATEAAAAATAKPATAGADSGTTLRLLARLYAAEALCLLGREGEALEILAGSASAGGAAPMAEVLAAYSPAPGVAGAGPPENDERPKDSSAVVAALGQAAIPAAIAALQLLRGPPDAAEDALRQAAAAAPTDPRVLRLQAYALLRKGEKAMALRLLREGRAVAGPGSGA